MNFAAFTFFAAYSTQSHQHRHEQKNVEQKHTSISSLINHYYCYGGDEK